MKLIDELVNELIEYSQEWNEDEITKEELNCKLELLIKRLELVELNIYGNEFSSIAESIKQTFSQLHFKTRYKAISCIQLLINTPNKASYNAKLRWILKTKLYYKQLFKTLNNNIHAYMEYSVIPQVRGIQIFVSKEGGTVNE